MFRFLLGHTHIWVAVAYGLITYMFTVIRHQLVRQLDNGAIRVRIRKMRNLCVRVPPSEVIQVGHCSLPPVSCFRCQTHTNQWGTFSFILGVAH